MCNKDKVKKEHREEKHQDPSKEMINCPPSLSRLIVIVKTNEDKPVPVVQAEVTVLKGGANVRKGWTNAKGGANEGEYHADKLEAGNYTVKAKHKCYKPEEGDTKVIDLGKNEVGTVELTLKPYEIKIGTEGNKPSYTIVLDKKRMPTTKHPILTFEITGGPPNHFFDIQLSRDNTKGLKDGPGLTDAWDSTCPGEIELYSSFSNKKYLKGAKLDESGCYTYPMPKKWWQDLYDTPLNQFDKSDFYYRVLAIDDENTTCTTSATKQVEVKKKYKTVLKIWLLTWNCENMAPSKEQLKDVIVEKYDDIVNTIVKKYEYEYDDDEIKQQIEKLKKEELKKELPDLIVVGLQEAVRANGEFVAERLESMLSKKSYRFSDYKFLGEVKAKGKTKSTTNYQALGVLVKEDKFEKAEGGDTKKCTTGFEGKGGVIFTMKWDKSLNLAFISAHLDSKDKENQKDNIKKIVTGIENLNEYFDAVFMMGDLNYRLDKTGGILTEDTTNEQLCEWLLEKGKDNKDKRKELLKQDLLAKECSLVQEDADPKFEFPEPEPVFFPSYKINYLTGKQYDENPKKRGRLTNNPSYIFFNKKYKKTEEVKYAMKTYFWKLKKKWFSKNEFIYLIENGAGKDTGIYNKDRHAFDIGWLDRIGWATKWTNVLSERGSNKVKVNMIKFIGRHKAVMSDHAAVLMKVEVKVHT